MIGDSLLQSPIPGLGEVWGVDMVDEGEGLRIDGDGKPWFSIPSSVE